MESPEEEGLDCPKPSVSMRSDRSKGGLIDFKDHHESSHCSVQHQGPDCPGPRCVSMGSDRSKDGLIDFKASSEQRVHQEMSDDSSSELIQKHQPDLDSTFTLLEENIMTFVKNELRMFRKAVERLPSADRSEDSEGQKKNEEEKKDEEEEEEMRRSNREAFLKITVNILQRMKQEELAEALHSETAVPMCQRNLKSQLKKKFHCLFEGITKAGNTTELNDVYTELYITEGGSGEVNDEHEIRQVETMFRKSSRPETVIKCEDIFQTLPNKQRQPVRTILTKGVAGIGKTVLTHKFTLDWAEDKTNHSIQFTFPFNFRELNLLSEKEYSLVELLHLYFPETKKAELVSFDKFKVVFIFDGLDECRLPLDFDNNESLSDVMKLTSVDVLLTNLIKGNLLPSAKLWITTRPAAANQIPPQYIDVVTEVRGFTDNQKKQYFKKRFQDEEVDGTVMSHIKTSQSLHIMCHIPVFCWITATVLEDMVKANEKATLPKTLTEMYIHFLVVQSIQGKLKYLGGDKTDSPWNENDCKMIMSLGKLAYEQLQKGNPIFYESDLITCGIDIRSASVYSGLLTQIFKEERGLYQNKVFCFVHLSFQEFLAALYVFVTFFNTGVNLLSKPQSRSSWWIKLITLSSSGSLVFQTAVDKALQSPNGHLDLFLRFLLGFSLKTNQTLLGGLLEEPRHVLYTNQQIVQYIKERIRKSPSPERCINLFHCLNELNDHSLVEEIQQYLSSGSLSTDNLSPVQWSALVFILLTSEKHLDVFDLRKFSSSEEGLMRLLPVIRLSTTSKLSGCNLSNRSCEALASLLSSQTSSLRELDLSNNDLRDSGIKLLAVGLSRPHCKLETLRLSGCLVTEEGCAALASALTSNPFYLKELDLSYNHPGELGQRLLGDALEDPRVKLASLSVDHGGAKRLKSGPKKYACDLTLDPNTVNQGLALSEDNRTVTETKEKLPYPDHPERFNHRMQVLCKESLTGRCYWEVERKGWVNIGVTYKGIKRKGRGDNCWIGQNDKSWSLMCSDGKFTASHKNTRTVLRTPPALDCGRVGVYLDCPAGTLSFYRVSSDTLIHLHTFHTIFTEPLSAAFGFEFSNFSVTLCQIKPDEESPCL